MLLVPEDLCAQIRACIVKEVDWGEQVDAERWVRALTPQPEGDAAALDGSIMDELRRGWAALDESERLRAELDQLRRELFDKALVATIQREEDDRPRAVIMDGSSRREDVWPLIGELARTRDAAIEAFYAERGPLVDRELSGEMTSDDAAKMRTLERDIDRLEHAERDKLLEAVERGRNALHAGRVENDRLRAENERLRAVLRGENEAANEACAEYESDESADSRVILRAAGRAVGVIEEE
jgi:regulator of replication initiation timing